MQKQIHLTALVFIFSLCQLNAQDLQFDLSKYKLPDYRRQLLDLNFNLSGSNQMNSYDGSPYNQDWKNNYNSYSNSFYMNYQDFLNTRRKQQENQFILNMNSGYSNQKNSNDFFYNRLSLAPQLRVSSVNRIFYQGTQFFEIDYMVDYRYSFDNTERNNTYYPDFTNSEKEQYHSVFTTVPIKFGTGRIEQVQDARQAVYILDELDKQHRITKIITDENVVEFATLISQLKNERYFDYRLQKIHELEVVDSFLRIGNYCANSDITYFTTLNDFWDYGRNQVRRSGSSVSMALYPSFNFLNYTYNSVELDINGYEYSSDGELNITSYAISGGMEFKHEKPVSLSFQSGTDISALFGLMRAKEKDSEDKVGIPNLQINATQRIGFYPNTRTNFDFYVKGSFVKFIEITSDNGITYPDGIGANFGSGFNFNYYISPQFRINANWQLTYTWQDSDDNVDIPFNQLINGNLFTSNLNMNYTDYGYYLEKEFYQSFSIGLVYSFF